MTDLLALFRAEGINVRPIGDWKSRVRPGTFAPVGIVVHHTGSKGTGEQGLDVLVHGRPDLNGPLCNASPRQDGSLDLISAGRANHAGAGSRHVLDDVRRDIAPRGRAAVLGLHDDLTGANGLYYGLEVDNSGGPHDDYPPAQVDTTVRACTALIRHHGWTANRVILHAEHTARKVDWSRDAQQLRTAVAYRLKVAVLEGGIWTIPSAHPAPQHPAKISPAPIDTRRALGPMVSFGAGTAAGVWELLIDGHARLRHITRPEWQARRLRTADVHHLPATDPLAALPKETA